MAFGQLQTFIHMGLKDGCAPFGIVQGVMGIGTILLVLDEPIWGMEFADIVIKEPVRIRSTSA